MGPTLRFFLLTYAVTWTCFISAAGVSHAAAPHNSSAAFLSGSLLLLGTIAPSVVALALAARAEGRAGTLALLRPILQWRVQARWYLFAVSYMAAIKLAAAF